MGTSGVVCESAECVCAECARCVRGVCEVCVRGVRVWEWCVCEDPKSESVCFISL
jgi:hypothetical protein